MFPLVQTFPQDCLVYIRVPEKKNGMNYPCTCFLVVWLHKVLDLAVSVRLKRPADKKAEESVHFGPSSCGQIVIEEVAFDSDPSITLLDSAGESHLSIKPGPETESMMIGSVKRIEAKGWGNALLNETFKELGYQASQRKFMARELQLVSVAFTQIIAHHLVKDDFRQSLAGIHVDKTSEALSPTNFRYPVDAERLIKSFKF